MLSDHHCHDFSDCFSGDVFYQRRISVAVCQFLLRVCHYFYRADAGKKRRALIVSLLEIILYMGLCLAAYHFRTL